MLQDNIRKYRKEKGFSQEELAVRLHVVRQTISKWEKGQSVPDAAVLIDLAGGTRTSRQQTAGNRNGRSSDRT